MSSGRLLQRQREVKVVWLNVTTCVSCLSVIFAPTELKVRARMSTLNVTWHPSPNHTQVSGYKLSCREVEPDEAANGEKMAQSHTVRLRKKARYHLLNGLGESHAIQHAACVYVCVFHSIVLLDVCTDLPSFNCSK